MALLPNPTTLLLLLLPVIVSFPQPKANPRVGLGTPTSPRPRSLVVTAASRANTRQESAKVRNRRLQRKEAAQKVGEELVKACVEMNISEISSYDRNGFARGERMAAFEVAIAQYGFVS